FRADTIAEAAQSLPEVSGQNKRTALVRPNDSRPGRERSGCNIGRLHHPWRRSGARPRQICQPSFKPFCESQRTEGCNKISILVDGEIEWITQRHHIAFPYIKTEPGFRKRGKLDGFTSQNIRCSG